MSNEKIDIQIKNANEKIKGKKIKTDEEIRMIGKRLINKHLGALKELAK